MLDFEWNDAKAATNLIKHGVDFAAACRVFNDVFAVEFEDQNLVDGEVRRIIIGLVKDAVLTVVFTERGETIRLISARKSTRKEWEYYADARQAN